MKTHLCIICQTPCDTELYKVKPGQYICKQCYRKIFIEKKDPKELRRIK